MRRLHPRALYNDGFSRSDLVATLAIIGSLLFLVFPAFARTREGSQGILCLSNIRALARAWQMYADDYHGVLPTNPTISDAQIVDNSAWALGFQDWSSQNQNYNPAVLSQLPFSGYLPHVGVYRCPSDLSRARNAPQPRIRSFSMNSNIGTKNFNFSPGYRTYLKLSDIVLPAPSQLFVFIQEHPDSINDPIFITPMDNPSLADYPASFHEGSGTLAFADGHCDFKLWTPATRIPVRTGPFFPGGNTTADARWLQPRTTARLP